MRCTSYSNFLRRPQRQLIAALLVPGLMLVAADAAGQLSDVKGSKDPSMLKRYEGSTIIGYDFRKFDEFEVLLGPLKPTDAGEEWSRPRVRESKARRRESSTPSPRGARRSRCCATTSRSCRRAASKPCIGARASKCGGSDGWLGEHFLYPLNRRLSNTPPPAQGTAGTSLGYAFSSTKDQQFLTARRAGPPADVYASVYVSRGTFDIHPETFDHALVLLDVVETAYRWKRRW